jgi:hypothetical protein
MEALMDLIEVARTKGGAGEALLKFKELKDASNQETKKAESRRDPRGKNGSRGQAENAAMTRDLNSMHEAIANLAYSYWEARGRQGGSAEEDWLRAEEKILLSTDK